MRVDVFVRSLVERRIDLSVKNGKLQYRGPREALNADLIAQIRARRDELIAYLDAPEHSASEAARPDGVYPLSQGQEALWFLYELDRASLAYNTLYATRMARDLDAGRLGRAVVRLAQRHGVLRNRFGTVGGTPFQRIAPDAAVALAVADVAGWPADAVEAEIARLADRPFDLENGPVARWHLLTGADLGDGHGPAPILVLVAHHLVSDFRSLEILRAELGAIYAADADASAAGLPTLPWSYADYVQSSRAWVGSPAGEHARAYWTKQLAGDLPVLDLPTDYQRPPQQRFEGATYVQKLPPDVTDQIQKTARRVGVTPYTVLLGVFGLLLSRYSGQRDLLVGSPMLGRGRSELAGLVGYFVNSVVLRLACDDGASGAAYLSALGDTVLEALDHQDYPFPLVVEQLQANRDPSRSPLFQVAFVYERPGEAVQPGDGPVRDLLMGGQRGAVFDITLTAYDGADGLRLTWEYASALFRPATIERLARHFARLLDALAADVHRPLAQLSLLDDAERAQLAAWNATEVLAPPERNLVDMIRAQVARTPDAPALDDGTRTLTYAELDTAAGALAARLQGEGAGRGAVVGVFMDRSIAQLVAMLAVMRAGAACLPLDPNDPAERRAYVLATAGTGIVVTDAANQNALPEAGPRAVLVGPDLDTAPADGAPTATTPAGPEDPVFVLFTSGSTGRPKGVEMPHRAIMNLAHWHIRDDRLGRPARTVQFSAPTFDVIFHEIIATWCTGGTLVVIDDLVRRDSRALLDWLDARRIERLFLPFVALNALAERAQRQGLPESLSDLVTAGEQLRATPAIRAAFAGGGCRLHNHYGPTETHVATTYRLPANPACWEDLPPIGGPIQNVRALVLDDAMSVVPVGVPGELWLAGTCLANGYLNQPELTAERFLDHSEHGRIYRTGDLVRRRPDGLLDYLGRRDDQVKIRGVRIELGEVEAVLTAHPAVREAAVVLDRNAATPRLCAYVARGDAAQGTDAAALRQQLDQHLRQRLPNAFVPASLNVLDRLPKTSSGKIDRLNLPAPEWTETPTGAAGPLGETANLLAQLWAGLLDLPKGPAQANFFELGGHSILAMQLIARIEERFGIELPLRALFDHPTVAGLADLIERQLGADAMPLLEAVTLDGPPPVSLAQQRLLFLERLSGPSATYSMPATLHLNGPLDVEALRQAVVGLVERHAALRSAFPLIDGTPVLCLLDPYDPLNVSDLSTMPVDARLAEAERLATAHAAQPFDLAEGPLFRLHLLGLEPERFWLLFNMHHVISDGWSLGVLVRELSELYRAACDSRPTELPALRVQYADFAAWQQARLDDDTLRGQLDYWRGQLEGAPTLLELPADRPRPARRSFRGGLVERRLDPALNARLDSFARAHGATSFMILVSAFSWLLARTSGQDDILIGTPVANRRQAASEHLIGLFLNTLVLRARPRASDDFAQLVARTQRTAVEAYANQDLPFEALVDALQPERSLAHSPLFQVMFVMQNTPMSELSLGSVKVTMAPQPLTVAKFDLTLYVEEIDDGLVTSWEYNADIFDADRIARLAGHFEQLLLGALADPLRELGALDPLTGPERAAIDAWSTGPATPPPFSTPLEGIEAQAARTPDAPAVVGPPDAAGERVVLSHAELQCRANRLANYLRAQGLEPGARIGICLPPSADVPAALLAAMKAGAAYVPIDPAYPADRIAFMLADSGARLLLTDSATAAQLDRSPVAVHCLDTATAEIAQANDAAPTERPTPDDLLYVIYTSGSTGQPKGAGVRHGGFANLLHWYVRTLEMGPDDRGLLVSALGFDLTQKNLFAPLIAGATLHLTSDSAYDPAQLRARIASDRITWINCTPSTFYPIADGAAGLDYADLTSLRWVVLGGEPIRPDRLAPWLAVDTCNARLLNSYGPTECTDVAVAGPVDPIAEPAGVALGQPIDNVRLSVVDAGDRPVPVGQPGELLIAGAGVGTGYLNRPEMTAARFVELEIDGTRARFYRTGDRVAWRADGRLDYLGRGDQQVKLRGFRIELEEIEASLRALAGVRDGAVAVQGVAGQERLAGYLVADSVPEPEVLRAALAQRLPDYMIPETFLRLDRLPLSANGKLDRAALPAVPEFNAAGRPDAAPRGATERLIADLWSSLLGVDAIDRDASFFAVGGHSLRAVQLIARIGEACGVDLPLETLFADPTVAGLASAVERGGDQTRPSLSALPADAKPAISFAQQRLLLLDQLEPGGTAYAMPATLLLRGALDVDALRQALCDLVARHDSLRTGFRLDDGHPRAHRLPAYDPLTQHDLTHYDPAVREAEADRLANAMAAAPFDLATGPLFRLHLVRVETDRHELLFNMHHIVSDGWSIDLLVEELAALYAAHARGVEPDLPAPALSYADYATWQQRCLDDAAMAVRIAYWSEQLAGAPDLLALPTDRPRPAVQQHRGGAVPVQISAARAHALRALARDHDATLFMVLLAAFKLLLFRASGERDISVGVPVANRPDSRLEHVVGLFLNTLVLRDRVPEQASFADFLNQVRATVLAGWGHQDVPFEALVEHLRPTRSLSHNPLFQVMLNLVNTRQKEIALDGLSVEQQRRAPDVMAKFDLNLSLSERADGALVGDLQYDAAL